MVNESRIIQRSIFQSAIDHINARVNSDPDYYRLRQQIIEHQFGTVKREWGFTHAFMSGKENVLAEVSILFTTYNLKRSLSILGFKERLNTLLFNNLSNLIKRYITEHHVLNLKSTIITKCEQLGMFENNYKIERMG